MPGRPRSLLRLVEVGVLRPSLGDTSLLVRFSRARTRIGALGHLTALKTANQSPRGPTGTKRWPVSRTGSGKPWPRCAQGGDAVLPRSAALLEMCSRPANSLGRLTPLPYARRRSLPNAPDHLPSLGPLEPKGAGNRGETKGKRGESRRKQGYHLEFHCDILLTAGKIPPKLLAILEESEMCHGS